MSIDDKKCIADLRKDSALPLTCRNCWAAWDDYVCSFNRLPISWLEKNPDWATPCGRFDDCPANDAPDIAQRLSEFGKYLGAKQNPFEPGERVYPWVEVHDILDEIKRTFEITFPEVS